MLFPFISFSSAACNFGSITLLTLSFHACAFPFLFEICSSFVEILHQELIVFHVQRILFFFSWITVEVSGLWFLHFVHISFCKEPGSLPPNDSKSNNLQCLTNWLKVCHIFHGPALGY